MTTANKKGVSCATMCWIIASIFGVIIALCFLGGTSLHWILALLAGIMGMFGCGWLLTSYFCGDTGKAIGEGGATDTSNATTYGKVGSSESAVPVNDDAEAEEQAEEENDLAAVGQDAQIAAEPVDAEVLERDQETATPTSPTSESQATSGEVIESSLTPKAEGHAVEVKYDGVEKDVEETESNSVQNEPKGTVPTHQAAAFADLPEGMSAAEDGKPALYTGRPESVDDLKMIKGVGLKLEQTLNELGIYTFAQITQWTAQDIAWVDSNLPFKGRIERDDWVSQAKTLAVGGETEFSKRVEKGGVY